MKIKHKDKTDTTVTTLQAACTNEGSTIKQPLQQNWMPSQMFTDQIQVQLEEIHPD